MTGNQTAGTQLALSHSLSEAPLAEAEPKVPGNGHQAASGSAADSRWDEVLWLPCRLSVELEVPNLTIGDLLRLEKGSVVSGRWTEGSDLPVSVNGQVIGWMEFEVVNDRLAVRVTELV